MDEEVLQDLYSKAQSKGYSNSFEDLVVLIQPDKEVQDEMFSYVQEQGYQKNIEDFQQLICVKKKDSDLPVQEEVTESITEVETPDTSLVSSEEVTEVKEPKKTFDPNVFREMTPEEKMVARIPEETQEKLTVVEEKLGRTPLTNVIGDLVRAWDQGQSQPVEESAKLYLSGKDVSTEEIQDYINQVKESQELGMSDEMLEFNKIYEEEGSGVYGFLKGLYNNPSVVDQVLVSSISSMFNPTVAGAALAGGVGGSLIPFIGTGIGAVGAATATLETALTFNELLQQELGDKDFTEENIREILNDSEKLNKIRTRAAGRGATIGVIDALTGKVAGKVAGKIFKKTADKTLGVGTGLGVEFVGGGTGEVAGRVVADQPMDVAEIGFEAVGGTATAPITLGKTLLAEKPKVSLPKNLLPQVQPDGSYTINGQQFTKEAMVDIITNMTEEDIGKSNAKFLIKNDPETNELLQTKLNNYAIQEQETGDILDAEPAEIVQEVEEEVRKPAVETEEEITEEEYSDFVETGTVTEERIDFIADKIKNNQNLNEKEQAIFTDKTTEVNDRLKQVKEEKDSSFQTVEEDIVVYKGTGGKRDAVGNLKTRHPGAEGSFFSAEKDIAETYKGEGEVIENVIPAGATIEEVQVDTKGLTPEQFNKAEEDAINASEADIVKLTTIENRGKGTMKEVQYIVKSKPSKERVDIIVDEIITKVKTRQFGPDTNPEVILESIKGYLEGSKFYEKATDIERENSVRQINEKLGIKIPKPPSVSKILGKPSRKKIIVDEMASLKDQIRLEARAGKEAVKTYKDISKSIINQVKELSKKGSITSNQSSVIIKKVLSTNMMNTEMVNRLTDYIDEVYTKAELAEKINQSKQKLKRAKKNLKNKVGASPDLQPVLVDLFAIDPSLIPLDKFDSYFNIIERFGEGKKVLSLPDAGEVMDVASDIINSIDEEVSTEIKETLPSELNQEIEADFDGYLNNIISNKSDLDNSYNQRGKDLGRYLNNLTKEDLIGLVKEKKDGTKDYSNLENLKLIKENISNGYVPKFAMDLKINVESNRSSKKIDNIVSKVKNTSVLSGFSRVYGMVKGLVTGKNKMTEALRSSPTFYIDDVMGNYNDKTLWENTLGKLSKSYSAFKTDLAKNVESKAEAAEALLYKTKVPTIQRETNAVQKSKYKIMTYRLQREFESNQGRKGVAPANDFIDSTIEFSVDGQISLEKIENSFTSNEKKALNLLDEINKSIEDKAIFTASVLRGEKINPINNYVHHSVAIKEKPTDVANKTEKMVKPSTKAGTLRERTPGSKPINFDPISSTVSGATETLLDYYMTEDVRTVNASISKAKKNIFDNKESSKISEQSINALDNLVDEVLTKTFSDSFVEYGGATAIVKKLQRLGYQAALSSIPRAGAELGSNLMYAMTVNPQGFITGVKDYGSFVMGNEGINAMENLGSAETMKLYDTKNMTGKMADSNLLYTGKPKASKSVTTTVEKAKYLSQFTGVKQVGKLATGIAENLISFPDKSISRPLWFGNFATRFKKITGIKLTDNDFQEIADGNSKYLTDEYKSAVEESTNFADEQTIKMATSTNPFNVIPKNISKPNESVLMQLYKTGNSYMARFSQYEYAAAKNAIVSMFRSGKITKGQATAALIGITTRMASYVVLYSILMSSFDSLFGIEDDEKEDVESLMKRQFIGAPLSLMTGRGLGNIPKIPINYALEMMNEEYLEDLRKGEKYDPYKHSIVFSQISKEDLQKKPIEELFLYSLSGPLSPLAKTVSRTSKAGTRAITSKTPETRQKYKDELQNRLIIEGLGNLGYVPFYKDIRRMIVKDMFKKPKKTVMF